MSDIETVSEGLDYKSMTRFEKLRTRIFLFLIGLYRRMTVGARVMMLRKGAGGKEVFLIKHTYIPGWHFPGGGVEPGETAIESAVREVFEETGHRVVGRPRLHGLFLNASTSDRDHVAVFICDEVVAEKSFEANMEIADGQWFGIDDLPSDINRGTRLRVREYAEGKPAADIW